MRNLRLRRLTIKTCQGTWLISNEATPAPTYSLESLALNRSADTLQTRLCDRNGTPGAMQMAALALCSIALGKRKGGLKLQAHSVLYCMTLDC